MVEKKRGKNTVKDYGEQYSSDVVLTAFIDGATFYSKEVQYTVVDGLAIFEGDIVLGTAEEVERKTEIRRQEMRGEIANGVAITGDNYRWPNCLIPYTIDNALPNQTRVTDAISHWVANTQVNFILRTAANAAQYPDFVTFRPGNGCSSWVGRQGGEQFITLAGGCSTGNTIHEIGHAFGLWHEHSREDRNAFVTINWAKIIPGREHNFNQHITDGDDIGAYDYGSVMHYGRAAFSIDGTDTITPTDSTAVIGQRTGLSAGDIAAIATFCPPQLVCPGGPVMQCMAAPIHRCPPAPIPICYPAPIHRCPPAPIPICYPAPIHRCPPAPLLRCPPAPIFCAAAPTVGCMAGPYMKPEIWRHRVYPEVRPNYFSRGHRFAGSRMPGYGYRYAPPAPMDYGYAPPAPMGYGYAPPAPMGYGYAPPAPMGYGYAPPAPMGYGYAPPAPMDYGYAPPAPMGYGYNPNWRATEFADPNEDCGCEGTRRYGGFNPR